jgi:hypothetical protein
MKPLVHWLHENFPLATRRLVAIAHELFGTILLFLLRRGRALVDTVRNPDPEANDFIVEDAPGL